VSTIADVISCSWGVPPGDFPMSTTLKQEMTRLSHTGGRRGKGLVFCIAAGNNNAPVQDLANTRTYRYKDRFGTIRSYSGPVDRWVASHPDAIVVSASTSRKTRSAYSSWGRNICVCAPSDNWDDLGQSSPAGLGITTTDNEGFGSGSDFTPNSRFTNSFGGTSSATPTVAGVCGLLFSANPALTAAEVKQLLQRTADKDMDVVNTDTPVNEPGTFDGGGFSLWFGHGKVNAFKAVQAASQGQAAEQVVDETAEAGMNIPDVGQVVTSSLDVMSGGTINDLRIQVNITHTFIGDLRVDVIAPDGTVVRLHNNTGGSADNLVKTYSAQELPALRGLFGKPVAGKWSLRVADTFRIDVGRLNRWRLLARVAGGSPAGPQPLARAKGAAAKPPGTEVKAAGASKEAGEKAAGRYAGQTR
jgi:subtilisin-like proprotein convertase family protein